MSLLTSSYQSSYVIVAVVANAKVERSMLAHSQLDDRLVSFARRVLFSEEPQPVN